jgi:hypothetical protein
MELIKSIGFEIGFAVIIGLLYWLIFRLVSDINKVF